MKRALLLFLLITTFTFAQSNPTPIPTSSHLSIEAIFAEGGLTGRAPETIKWSPDGTKVSFLQRDDTGEHGALYYVDVATGKKAVLVAEEKLASLEPPLSSVKDEREKERIQRYSVAGYHWAPDSKHLLFSAKGQLWLYSLDNGTAVQMTSSTDASSDPKFSKDGKHIAFVRKHNLWVKPAGDERERQLTTDKDENLLNGEVDWVYAEELDVRSNYSWSPNGKEIAFLQMNETKVPSYPIVDWLPQHPRTDQEKYPKAGDPNPEVRVGVIGAGGGKVKWIEVGKPEDREYIPRFGWVRDGIVWVQLLNRAQSKLDLYFVDVNSGKSQRVLSETSDAWVPVTDMFQVLDSGDRFIWPSWRDGFMQLYLYSFDKNNPLAEEAKLERLLTPRNNLPADYEVQSLAGVDEAAGKLYFEANLGSAKITKTAKDSQFTSTSVVFAPNDVLQKQLFVVELKGSSTLKKVSQQDGTHDVTVSPDNKYYVDTFSAWATPPKLSLCKLDGTCTAFWQSRTLDAYNLPVPKRLELKAADGKRLFTPRCCCRRKMSSMHTAARFR